MLTGSRFVMMRRPFALAFILAVAPLTLVHAQRQGATSSSTGTMGPVDLSTKPGRAPDQPIDEAYTAKSREYTTEPFFLSPLVDYLPASSTVPTPKAVLGDIARARHNLPHSEQIYGFIQAITQSR